MPIIADSTRLALNAFAVLVGQTPGTAALVEHQAYVSSLNPVGYKAALDQLFRSVFTTPQLATALLSNLGLTGIFTQADAVSFLTSAGNNRIGAMIDLADSLYNYTGSVPSLVAAKVAYARGIDLSFDYSTAANSPTVLVSALVSGRTFTLTTGGDIGAAFTGGNGQDTFNALVAGAWSPGDALDGGAGQDIFNVIQTTAITLPTGVTVANIETLNLTSGATGTSLNTAVGFAGLTTLNLTSISAQTLVAAVTTAINVTNTQSDGVVVINGGAGITLTEFQYLQV